MDVLFETTPPIDVACDWLILPVRPSETPTSARELAAKMEKQGDLDRSVGALTVVLGSNDVAADRICFVGFGEDTDDVRDLTKPLASAFQKICGKATDRVALVLPSGFEVSVATSEAVRTAIVAGLGQSIYQSDDSRQMPKTLVILHERGDDLEGAVERGRILGESMNAARDLVNRHAGDIYPQSFATKAEELAGAAGLACEVYDEDWMAAEKFGSMLAVGQGSEKASRLVVLRHNGAGPDAPLYGLCGKGVTFDSGGLSIKPSDGMKTMKADMGGGATVLGTMLAIARLNLPVNIVASIGLVENMISGNSYRLGDVLTARNGVTIEVHNTDAEGRLVLADVLSWTVDQGADRIIDLATLTGACVVALGEEITGLFPNDDEWATEILDAAEAEGEDVWQLPMHDAFNEQLKSDVADCKNVGTRWGGATTAAKFLEKFVGDATWAHLDIAGPAFANSAKSDRDGGGTGVMVRSLVRLYERLGS